MIRTAPPPDGGELLKFWVFGHEVLIPVVATPCAPGPLADAGPDQTVFTSTGVTLDGSASLGAGLTYCWIQTQGPDVGLPDCTEDVSEFPTATFTSPASPATLSFELHVRNACDHTSQDEVTITVTDCPAAFTLGNDRISLSRVTTFRDRVLARNAAGQQLISDYYRHAGELTGILVANPDFLRQAAELLRLLSPEISRLTAGKRVNIRVSKLNKIGVFLKGLSGKANPELRAFLDQTRKQLMDETVLRDFGVNIVKSGF